MLLPIWNAWYFLTLYANAAGRARRGASRRAEHVLDRYALAKTRQLVDAGHRAAWTPTTSPARAPRSIAYLDSLNNWYIRRSRDRFWAGDQDAVDTLHTVLEVLCRVGRAAAAAAHRHDLAGTSPASAVVHLTDWPSSDDAARTTPTSSRPWTPCATCARRRRRSARPSGCGSGCRWRSLTVAAPDADALAPFVDLIADEVNVKAVELTTDVGAAAELVLQLVPARARSAGRRRRAEAAPGGQGGRLGAGRRRRRRGRRPPRSATTSTRCASCPKAGVGQPRPSPATPAWSSLDLEVTPELEAEGLVRDVVRAVNEVRRADGLHVSDRIHLVIDAGHHHDVRAAIEAHRRFLQDETLAVELLVNGPISNGHRAELADGRALHIGLHVVG